MKPIPIDPSHLSLGIPIQAAWLSRSSLEVASDLVGCTFVRQFPDGLTLSGMIVETEAYTVDDPACHAYRGRTARNTVMFGPAGMSYVYFIYGMYHCLNVVTDRDGIPSAVLIRAVQLETLPSWVDDRQAAKPHRVAAGPGKLCRAFKIDLSLTAQPFSTDGPFWITHRSPSIQRAIEQNQMHLLQTTRIGITQGTEFPWRWYLQNSPAVSKP